MHMKTRALWRWLERWSSSLPCLFTRVLFLWWSASLAHNDECICPISFVWRNWHPHNHLKNATHVDRHRFCPKGVPTPSWHPSCTGRVLVSLHGNPSLQAYCLSYPWLPSYRCISVPPCDNPYTHMHSVCSTPWHPSYICVMSVQPCDTPHEQV